MILIVNIGNSSIRFGIFDKDECIRSWTANTKPNKTEDEFFIIFQIMHPVLVAPISEIKEIVIGSVVPHLTYPIRRALRRLYEVVPILVDRETPSSIYNITPQMGTDLYANAVAAQEIYKGNKIRNKIVVDFGTALTFTCINDKGKILGVVIAPGVNTSINSLVKDTAQLPNIELKTPKSVLGMNTEACMQSGVVFGFTEMVDGLVRRIKNEIQDEEAVVIATGGLGHKFTPLSHTIQYYDRLHTIKGLRLLYLKSIEN